MYRFLRCFLCLLVVCCLILNLSPIKADAAAATVAIAGASTVAVPAAIVVGAGLIALGIMAGTNDDFQRVVGNAVDSLGDWVKDGTVELIQTVDTLGKKAYYVAGDMLDSLHSFIFTSATVNEPVLAYSTSTVYEGVTYNISCDKPFSLISSWCIGPSPNAYLYAYIKGYSSELYVNGSKKPPSATAGDYNFYYVGGSSWNEYWSRPPVCSVRVVKTPGSSLSAQAIYMVENNFVDSIYSDYDLTLGRIASSFTNYVDGTSAREWSEEYTNRGLYVVEGSGGSSTPPEGDSGDDGNENNGKWYWPLVLGAAAFGAGAGIGALTQQDQWTGDTPEDFNDYTTGTEYEIVGSPEVEFGTGIELVVPDPAPDSGGDSGDNPGAGTDPDVDPDAGAGGSNDYSSWLSKILTLLEKIWNSILEIPTKFATWFDNIISEIQELPSKFATWFENIISAIRELPSKFADWFGNLASKLENIWEAICNIPEAIGNVLRSIFVPSEDFLTEKVQDLRSRFNWIEPILGYGDFIKAQLVNPEPPVLYVHLGNAEGSYNYGGTVKFLDLTWYERYKSQGDAIISGFLWALFAWRMYVKLPGIINGVAGDVGHISYGESAWQKAEGRKDRKEKGGKNK